MGFVWSMMRLVNAFTAAKDHRRMKSQPPIDGVALRVFDYLPDGNPMHALNVYRPEDRDGVLPLILDIHGGGWTYGDKDLNGYYARTLAKKGFVVVTPSYRLLPETDLKGQLQDIFAAADCIGRHAAEWGADLNDIMLTGDSAGAHLALATYAIGQRDDLQAVYGVGKLPFTVSCIVLSHGACDVHELALRMSDGKPFAVGKIVQRQYSRMMFGKHPEDNLVSRNADIKELCEGVEFPYVMVIGCDRDIFRPHTKRLDAYFRTRAKEYLFSYTEGEEGKRLEHVFNIIRPEWEESVKVNDLSVDFFLRSRGNR